ncbi:MAG: peptidylprolyl isomerase [Thermodesulfobacteriota bacterium]
MLKFMRKKTKSIFIYVIFTMIILVFILWGVGGIKKDKSSIVANINGKLIQRSDFLKIYRNQLDFYRNLYKDNFSKELLESLNLKERVLDGMVENALILQEAERLNIKVSTEEIFDRIKTTPAFQQDKVFDRELYLRLLKSNRIFPGEYEKELEKEVLIKKMQNLILQRIKVSDAEVKEFFDYEQRKVNLRYITVAGTYFKDIVSLSDSEVSEYFEKNSERFKAPDRFRFNYLLFRPEDFKDDTEATGEETEETQKINMGKARNKASDIADRAFKDLVSLKETAEKEGLKVEDTGFITKGEIRRVFSGERNVAEEATSLGVGKMSQPIDGTQGVYILEVVEMEEGVVPPYEAISQQVNNSLTNEKAVEMARETSKELLKRLKDGEDIVNLSEERGLNILETGFFSKKDRLIPALDIPVREGVSVFSLTTKDPFTVLTRGDRYYLVKLKDVQTPSEEEYNQEKDTIKKGLLEAKRRETLSRWIESLKNRSEVEINQEAI